jgi:hypothetical protein
LTIRRPRQLVLAGLAAVVFSGIGLTSSVAAEPDHRENAPEAVSLSRAGEPLPGGDSTVPGLAIAVLLGSAGLAWVVRRSAPAPALVVPAAADELAPVRDLSPRRQGAGNKASVTNPAAA